MKSKAFINLPQWVPVVWIAAALSVFSFILNINDVDWASYVSLPSAIVDAILWGFIMVSLHKRGNIKPILMVFIVLSLIMSLVSEIADFFVEDTYVSFIASFSWMVADVFIIANYVGAFRKYAIVELLCLGGIIAVWFIYGALDIDMASSHGHSYKWIIYPFVFLAYYPYQVLMEALSENEETLEREDYSEEKSDLREDPAIKMQDIAQESIISPSLKNLKPFQWFTKCLRQYADFKGRARRKEFWMFVLFYQIFSLLCQTCLYILNYLDEEWIIGSPEPAYTIISIIYGVLILSLLIPGIAVNVRRLHDVGKSGWFLLVALIPIVGIIWLIILYCKDGESGLNKYGENPKAC